MSLINLPKQKISKKEKLAKPKDGAKAWGEKCLDAIIESASFQFKDKQELLAYYQAYNGDLDSKYYSHIVNPYNSKDDKYLRYPAKIRNYNILKPIADLMLGEKSKQPFSFSVISANEDSVNLRELEKQQLIKNILTQKFINELNNMGMRTGMDSKETPELDKVIRSFDNSYKDNRAIMGQEALEYLDYSLNLKDELQDAFFDWLISGQVYTYKGILYDDVDYEVINPLDLFYHASPNVKFIEDADWVCRKSVMTVNEVVDKFRDYITEEQIDLLENPYSAHSIIDNLVSRVEGDSGREIAVYHCVWKSFRKIGFLYYLDELGETQTEIVSEEFKIDDPETQMIEWEWISEVWEGYKIDRDIYIKIQPSEVQRNELNNISSCKLPYNGRIYSNRNASSISVISMGIPYQVLYNIFHYKLELSVAKNKDKILLMEINTIPKRHGWDEEKFMYWADANGVAFIDSTAEGKSGERVTFNQFQVLDMTLGQYIDKMFQLLMSVKQEWEDMLGITRQRKGETLASDAVGNNERAVFQSSVITEEMFRRFRNFERSELQGLLDVSKVAWKDGKKATYVNSEQRQIFLDIEPSFYAESEFGVFVVNSSEENTKLETLRNVAMSFAQNGSRPSTIAEILDAGNFSKIKSLLKETETLEQQLASQQAQLEQQMQEKLAQMEIDNREDMQLFESIEKQKDRDLQIKLKNMEIQNKPVEVKQDDTQKLGVEKDKIRSNELLKQKELASKEKIEFEKIKLGRDKLDNDLKIAKSRPKPVK